ncbi:MAG: UDP-N-acetylglucosamine 2-epimerase, partial [Pseudomonadota bacterium]|nr:UDP-N-acetylglucosamine 2-epimerase [Pseudomonadota bacterium]
APRVPLERINEDFGLKLSSPFFLVTYHPVTAADESPSETFHNVLTALDAFPEHQVLFTYPNSDNGGDQIIQMIEQHVAKRSGVAWAVASLGMTRYLSAVEASACVIGNSSSGIIEVPSLGVPAVNVGVRQKGRLSAESVIHVGTSATDIRSGIEQALTEEAIVLAKSACNPYGGGATSERIVDVLLSAGRLGAKVFYDIPGAGTGAH